MVGFGDRFCARHRDWGLFGWGQSPVGYQSIFEAAVQRTGPIWVPLATDTVVEGGHRKWGQTPGQSSSGVSVNIKAAGSEDCSDRPTWAAFT